MGSECFHAEEAEAWLLGVVRHLCWAPSWAPVQAGLGAQPWARAAQHAAPKPATLPLDSVPRGWTLSAWG